MDQELQRERYELVTGRIREIAKEESVPARYQEYFQKTALFLEKVDETLQKKQQGLLDAESEEEAKKRNVYDENANFLNERPIDSFLYSIAMSYGATNPRDRYIDFVKELTEQENCIIIGRCANHIYRDDKDCVSVYLHADREIRCERIQKRDQISEREALKMIQEVDEKRAAFQEQCTSTKWGDGNEYDLCINTGIIGIEYAVEMILEYIRFENIL